MKLHEKYTCISDILVMKSIIVTVID